MADADSKPYGVIYLISNTANGKRYIGQTVQSLSVRWGTHCRVGSRCKALSAAIEKYGKDAFTISEIACAETKDELNSLEQFYVNKFQTLAPDGYNIKEGGGSKGKWPEEFRKTLSAATKAGQNKPGVRERMSEGQKASWQNQERRDAQSLALKKACQSPEARKTKSIAMKAVWADPEFRSARMDYLNAEENKRVRTDEYREKMRKISTGRKFGEEARANMSAAALKRKRYPMSDEQKKKISVARTGVALTDEHRANLSAARKRYIELGKEKPLTP